MKKRLLACVLSFLLVVNLSVPAFANGAEYLVDDMGVVPESYPAEIPDDIKVNPEDYILNSGISFGSLGFTLSIGQIAALIAAGGGVIYASQYLDDLGLHLSNALNTAAGEIDGRTAALTQWLADASAGYIALKSAPDWIAQAITNMLHGFVTSSSVLVSSPYGGYSVVGSGSVVGAGTPVLGWLSVDTSTGEVTNALSYSPTVDCYVYRLWNRSTSGNYNEYVSYSSTVYFFNVSDTGSFSVHTSTGAQFSAQSSYVGSDGKVHHYCSITNSTKTFWSGSTADIAYTSIGDQYLVDGAITDGSFDLKACLESLYGSGVFNPTVNPLDPDVEVAPDVLVGGLPDVWLGQGLGADVITFPDILLDGSTVLNPDTTLEGDAAIDAAIESALDKLATGELAWDDYWLDISKTGTVPTAKVEDTTTGDLVDKPIGSDGTLKDPVVVPDYSTNLDDYKLDLKGIFPFCIPFDIYNFLSCLAAEPVAPSWDWQLIVPFTNGNYSVTVDLSPFDSVAVVFRNFELLIFIVGLGIKTRDIIKG